MKIFFLVCYVIVPIVMIVFGIIRRKGGPEKVSSLWAYRSAMSMKNKDTWNFAHTYLARKFLIWGVVAIIATVALLFTFYNSGKIVFIMNVTITVQIIFFFGAVISTEKALDRTFDKSGARFKPIKKVKRL